MTKLMTHHILLNYHSYATEAEINEMIEELFPMAPNIKRGHQKKDKKLQEYLQTNDDYFLEKEEKDLIMYKIRFISLQH